MTIESPTAVLIKKIEDIKEEIDVCDTAIARYNQEKETLSNTLKQYVDLIELINKMLCN
jgi:prefoldin subunit 5